VSLADRRCAPCHRETPRVDPAAAASLLVEINGGPDARDGHAWTIDATGHLARSYRFADFASALRFANVVGAIADEQGHHPDLHVGWGSLRVEVWTHAIGGLSDNDFILAAGSSGRPLARSDGGHRMLVLGTCRPPRSGAVVDRSRSRRGRRER